MSFWDSSAIVPLCAFQKNSAAARSLARKLSGKAVWCGYVVEVSSAFARLQREGLIDSVTRRRFETRLSQIEGKFAVVGDHEHTIELARTFPALYGLKAMDSIQLAAALVWCKKFPKNKDFVSADSRLSEAAESAGFTVHLLD